MKIIINALYTAPGGGLVVLTNLLKFWIKNNELTICKIFVGKQDTFDELNKKFPDLNIVFIPQKNFITTFFYEQFLLPLKVNKILPDYIITNNFYIRGIKCKQVVHHQQLWTLFSKHIIDYIPNGGGLRRVIQTILARNALKKADINIFISDYMKKCAKNITSKNNESFITIYNGIQLQKKPAHKNNFNSRIISAVQTHIKHKNNKTLLLTIRELIKYDNAWHLKIAGTGNWDLIKREIKELGIGNNISFTGYLNNIEMNNLFSESFCLFYPSYFEGFGLPVIESMSCGCPVIATNKTALPEIGGEAALYIEPDDYQTATNLIINLSQHKNMYDKQISHSLKNVRRFSWEASANKFINLLKT